MRRKRPWNAPESCQIRESRVAATHTNERWSMDFIADQLYCGQRFRILTLVDNFSRVSLAIHAGKRLTGDHVVKVLEQVSRAHGFPNAVQVDNGPEFISKSLDWWAYWNKVKLDFSRPGKPTDNAVIESFNGRLRQECLNQHWLLSLDEAQEKLNDWKPDYNLNQPHSSLGQLTPAEFAASHCPPASASATPQPTASD